jgi:hypothetical protein
MPELLVAGEVAGEVAVEGMDQIMVPTVEGRAAMAKTLLLLLNQGEPATVGGQQLEVLVVLMAQLAHLHPALLAI